MPARNYITVSFPQDIIDETKDILNSGYLKGYRTYTEFCVDSVRHRIEDIKKEMREEKFPKRKK